MSNLNSMLQSHRITAEGLKGFVVADVAKDKIVKTGFKTSSEAFEYVYNYVKEREIKTNVATLADYGDHYVVHSTY